MPNELKIVGFNVNSFVDFPSAISAVVFLGGCNLNCWYCHNRWMLDEQNSFKLEDVIAKIDKKKRFLDGVVITGGEPTIYDVESISSLITTFKNMELMVKLDSNGLQPQKLEKLLPLVDYVAMDVKAPLDKYSMLTPCPNDTETLLKESIDLIKTHKRHEFRTTVFPDLTIDDIESIAKTIEGAQAYYLQQYNAPSPTCPPSLAPNIILEMCKVANKYVPTKTRGI